MLWAWLHRRREVTPPAGTPDEAALLRALLLKERTAVGLAIFRPAVAVEAFEMLRLLREVVDQYPSPGLRGGVVSQYWIEQAAAIVKRASTAETAWLERERQILGNVPPRENGEIIASPAPRVA